MKQKNQDLYVGGRWRASASGETLPVQNPSTGETLGQIACGGAADIDEAAAAARLAFDGAWGKLTAAERGRLLARLGEAVQANAETLAQLECADVGKPLTQARADVAALSRYLEFYGGAADKVHGAVIPYLNGYTVYAMREPHGVTGHIIPWNYPMQILGRSVFAALAMGNTAVLKPAEDASLTALEIAKLAQQTGFPDGALNVVTGLGPNAGAALASHPGVNHISFTGSFDVGVLIQSSAARNATPVTLELGGKSPQLIFNDADLNKATPFLVNAAIQNAGQTCSAGARLLVQRAIYQETVARLAERFKALRAGPALADLDLGPLISSKQKARVLRYAQIGRRDLTLAGEGKIVDDAPDGGHYVAPLLFADVSASHLLAQEEIFGPVLVVTPFDDEDEAISMANGTPYGLVASIWTSDGARQMRVAKALRAGQVFINNYGAGGGVELPFGGVGRSGHGREKGMEALYAFSTLKTVAAYHG